MNKVRLGDIADVSAGGTPARGSRSFWGGGIPWIKISDLKSKYVNSYDETITRDGLENSSAKLFPKGTILYTIFATLGRVGILNIDAATNQAIAGILIKSQAINPNYLYHFLCSQEKRVNEIGKGVAQKNINLSILRDWMVPLPAINVQKRVSATLDQIRDGIEKNKVSSRLLDEQVKSLFNELKSSHLSDSPTLTLEDVCSYVVDCPHTTPKYDEEQLVYPCIRTSEIGIGTISWETMKYVGEREYGERIARLQPKKGDIVFGREGTIGHAAILPEDNRFCLGQRTMIMRCKENKCLPEFLLAQLLSGEIKELLLRRNVASTVAHVNVKEVRQIPIFCPPISVQKTFANQLQQIDKLRFNYQRQIEVLQELLDKKMKEYFGG